MASVAFKIKEKRYTILLSILIFIGILFRFYHLGYNSLWYDEAFTLFAANHSLAGIWDIASNTTITNISLQFDPNNPPLFYFIEHFMLMFGKGEFVVRFIPALLGVLTIPVFYYIGKEFEDHDVGIIMAALLTFSPFHVYYSQEARAYSAMPFFFSLALFFFLFSLRTNKIYSWILFGFFSGLTLWTHYYTLIPLGILFTFSFFWGIRRTRNGEKQPHRYLLSLFSFVLVSLPLVPLILNLYNKRTSTPPLPWGVKGFDIIFQTFNALSEYHRSISILFSILFIIGIVYIWKNNRFKAILIFGLLAVPILISIFLAEKVAMDERYLFYLLPVFFIGISFSLKSLAGLFKIKNITIIIVVIFFIIQSPFLALYYNTYFTQYSREDWRGMAQNIEGKSAEGDFIIVVPYYTRLPLDLYYSNKSDKTYEFGVRNVSEITSILMNLKNHQAYFVVTDHIKSADPTGNTIQWLKNNTKPIGFTKNIELDAVNFSG
jgi:uncharacterized membrane protein